MEELAQAEYWSLALTDTGVHVVRETPEIRTAIADAARKMARSFFDVDLSDARTTHEALSTLSRELLFPKEASDFNVWIDLISDNDWFPNENGYVLVLTGMDGWRSNQRRSFRSFLSSLWYVCDRWLHVPATPFGIVLLGDTRLQREAVRALTTAHDEMARGPAARHRLGLPPVVVRRHG